MPIGAVTLMTGGHMLSGVILNRSDVMPKTRRILKEKYNYRAVTVGHTRLRALTWRMIHYNLSIA